LYSIIPEEEKQAASRIDDTKIITSHEFARGLLKENCTLRRPPKHTECIDLKSAMKCGRWFGGANIFYNNKSESAIAHTLNQCHFSASDTSVPSSLTSPSSSSPQSSPSSSREPKSIFTN
jgi:hypothetical protein